MVVTGYSIEYCEHIFGVQRERRSDGGLPFHHGREAFRPKFCRYASLTTDLDRGVTLGVLRDSSFSFYLVSSTGRILLS
jgi:hypothetical protein